MDITKGVLKSFNATSYTATVQLAGSYKAYLEGIAVARNIPGVEMVAGRKLAIVLFDEHNPKEAVVVGVYG
jgi:hypothetical protein